MFMFTCESTERATAVDIIHNRDDETDEDPENPESDEEKDND